MTLVLKCWGNGWAWRSDCQGENVALEEMGKVSLSALTRRAVKLTWYPSPTRGHPQKGRTKDLPRIRTEDQGRYYFAKVPSGTNIIIDDVDPAQVYQITLAPESGKNMSSVFFKIEDNITQSSSTVGQKHNLGANGVFVRAEEVGLVLLALILWFVAIALFVHRWGKIRMLEPYQPDYKPMTHQLNCPLVTSPTQLSGKASHHHFVLPRKSSSLCFTPSMLRTPCRGNAPRPPEGKSRVGCPFMKHNLMTKQRACLSSDSHSEYKSGFVHSSRKVRSAENLRAVKHICLSAGQSEDGAPYLFRGHTIDGSFLEVSCLGKHCHANLMSQSLENCQSRKTTQYFQARGKSLDSAGPKKSPPSIVSYFEGRTTPELRISPSPPEQSHTHGFVHQRQLQRQETLDETLGSLPYATLHEEVENEFEEVTKISITPPPPPSPKFAVEFSISGTMDTEV